MVSVKIQRLHLAEFDFVNSLALTYLALAARNPLSVIRRCGDLT
jgi:hypothetical protein